MTKSVVSLFAASLVFGLSPMPASAQSPSQTTAERATAASQAAAQPKAKTKKICKVSELTGTRLRKKRICATKEQWDAAQQQAGETTRELTKTVPPPSN